MTRKVRVHHEGRWWTADEIAAYTGIQRKAVYKRLLNGVRGPELFVPPRPGRKLGPDRKGVLDPDLPYERDELAQRYVAAHPDGMDLRAIGDLFGVSPQAVELTVQRALRKLGPAAERLFA